ncbi:DUF4394 domain-containing protein [Aquabacterium sp. J223]|uniref:DUF4394 domain-containing protein n=1 Tax=Aquabacterium sp. J223 TaxID=2898431 RepID=UPI0021AD7394|nr:DUF4394 domain-containing protein [Aquabacterium sp. J223]UUX94939.1 DUF4394 domain-containing protein [Aquabacterium sp. J223]
MPSARILRSALPAALLAAGVAHAAPIVGLTTTNALITFDSATPSFGSALAGITGLQSANERILAIDLRPTTGLIYGVSTDSKVYTLGTNGAASFVALLGEPLVGDAVDIDFNPVADVGGMASLRVVSSSGQNLAFNVANGATTIATDIQSNFAAVAYSNNDTDPGTGTALYYVDSAADVLKVATANFNAPVINTVGALGFNANGVAGLDIAGASTAFAALTNADTGKSGLYGVNLATGAASFVGEFGIGGNLAVAPPLLDLTVAPIPEPETYALMLAGLGAMGWVARRRRATQA